MGEATEKRHSKLGIASCLVAFCVWIYFVTVFYLFFYVDGFSKYIGDAVTPESHGMTDLSGMGVAIVAMTLMFVGIPIFGHAIGLLIGTIGVFRSSKKRLFSAVGILLNLLPIFILLLLFAIGSLTSSSG